MFSCVFSCEEETALSIIDPTSALVELNNARRQKGRKTAGLLDIAEEQLPSLEVSRMEVLVLLSSLVLMFVRIFSRDVYCFLLHYRVTRARGR